MSVHLVSTGRTRLGWLAAGAAIGVMTAVALAPSFGSTSTRAADPTTTPAEHTISVTGDGLVLIKPDVADLSLGVTIQRPKAKDAAQAAADAMSKVVDALKAEGIADVDIQTANLSLSPTYDYSTNKQVLTGFEADNIVTVTVRDLTKAGETVDAAVQAGATSVNGITFRVNDPTAVQAQARAAAMKDAKTKADALAQAAGVNITGVQSISEVSSPVPTPVTFDTRAAAGMPAASVPTPVQPGNIEVDVSVTVTYLIP